MFNVNQYISENRLDDGFVPVKICKDGFSISIQASKYHRSSPDELGLYATVECGFPSMVPAYIMQYCEDPEFPTRTVYNYVPVELVEALINFHDGLMGENKILKLKVKIKY